MHSYTDPGSAEHTDLVDWHTTSLLYIYICFHDYCIVVTLIFCYIMLYYLMLYYPPYLYF